MEEITDTSVIETQKSVNDEREEDLLWEEFHKTKSAKLRVTLSVSTSFEYVT